MEKNELAEENCCFGRDDDIDSDALSYIDEKIQHLLGNFQKDFEGVVSAESLGAGAKFAEYGSFLTAFSCSPSISLHLKSPLKMPNHNVLRSSYNFQSQDGHQNPYILGTTPIKKISIVSGEKLTEKSVKRKTSISTQISEGISKSLSKPVHISDKKMLKVQIKVGHDDGLPINKPDIYSDLGLDVSPSPSPSLEDTPNGNEECSPESPDAFLESPTTILQIMTSFSVPGGYILSPLPDSLQHSNGKEDIFLTNFKRRILYKGQAEACAALFDTSLDLKFVNGFACEKIKSGEKRKMLRETDGFTCKGDMMPFLKKEMEAKDPVLQEVIYNAPDMSHSSRARCGDARDERQINGSSAKEMYNTAGNFKDPDKLSLKVRIPSSKLSTDNLVGSVESMRYDFAGNSEKEDIHSNGEVNSKSGLTIKSFEERIGNGQDTSCEPAEIGSKALKNYSSTNANSRRYNSGWKNHTTKHWSPANHNPAQKATLCEKDLLITIKETDHAYEEGRVPSRSPTNDIPCTEPSKENPGTSSSVAPKRQNELSYESKLKAHKLHKKVKKVKAIESHKGFGVSTYIQKVNENKHTLGSSRFVELHKVDNLRIANLASGAQAVAPLACNAPTSDAPATISASVLKDNWVFCDLCQTWRLLPYGTNPDNLPKEWQCSMQVWLPGLNKCYISEDETTKAIHDLYQVLVPDNGTDFTVHPVAAVLGITSDDISNHNGRQENNGVKEKHGLPDASNLFNGYLSSSWKKKSSLENRSLNDVIRYPQEMYSSFKHSIEQTSRSADLTMAKHNHKVEEKPSKILASCPNEGDLFGKGGKNSRLKRRRQVDLDGHRSFKKIKKDGLKYSEKDVHTEVEIVGKRTINGDCDLPPRASRKVFQSSGFHSSSKDFKPNVDPSKNPKASVVAFSNGEHKKHPSASSTEKISKCDSNDKKRGRKELQESGTHHKNSMISQQLVEHRPIIKDGSIESEPRMQKKPRMQKNAKVAKSEGQDSSAVIVDGKMNKKGCLTRIKLSSNKKYQPDKVDEDSIHAFVCVDAMKRDLTNVQLVTAATSSSSKASGFQKSEVNLQEARVSPVESVSSSPIRLLNTQNSSTKVSLSTKDDILSIGHSLRGSPKSIYNFDVDASDQSVTLTKDLAYKSHLIISKNSKAVEPGVVDSLSISHDYQGRKANCFSVGKTGDVMYLKRGTHDAFGQADVVFNEGNVFHQLTKYPVELDKNSTCDQNEHHDYGHQKFGQSSLHCRESKKDSTFGANKGEPKILDAYSDHKELEHLPSKREDNFENYSKQHKVNDLRVTATGESYTNSISQDYFYQASSNQKVDHSSQKSTENLRKSDSLNEILPNIFCQPFPTVPERSPVKKDLHITINALIQEARDLKHTANRLKNDGLEHESSVIFFEASLKFLHVASLMEPPGAEFVRQGELFPSMQMLKMYIDTATFSGFCAHEYEKLKEMAAAALAYKCAEVAYMKVAYFKHPSASKDRHELQAALDAALPGESPSSTYDIDMLNNQGIFKKAASVRASGSPQLAANYVIAASNRPHVNRLLTYTNYLNCAFEAAKKSRNAIAAASFDLEKDKVGSLCSVRKVLDFNFNNVEGLLQLVRVSLKSISRQV